MRSGASTIGAQLAQQDTFEELYYIVMGIQYPITPLLITERPWHITVLQHLLPFSHYFAEKL